MGKEQFMHHVERKGVHSAWHVLAEVAPVAAIAAVFYWVGKNVFRSKLKQS